MVTMVPLFWRWGWCLVEANTDCSDLWCGGVVWVLVMEMVLEGAMGTLFLDMVMGLIGDGSSTLAS